MPPSETTGTDTTSTMIIQDQQQQQQITPNNDDFPFSYGDLASPVNVTTEHMFDDMFSGTERIMTLNDITPSSPTTTTKSTTRKTTTSRNREKSSSRKDASSNCNNDDNSDDAQSNNDNKYGYEEAAPTVSKRNRKNGSHYHSRRRHRQQQSSSSRRSSLTQGSSNSNHSASSAASLNLSNHSASSATSSSSGSISNGVLQEAILLRSCLKGANGPRKINNNRHRRRASIQFGDVNEVEVLLPGHQKPIRRRSSITFAKNASVKQVQPMASMVEDPHALWFQIEEFELIKLKAMDIVGKVDTDTKNNNTGVKKYCTRGLEHYFHKQRKSRKFEAWDCVMQAQHTQKLNGTFNEHDISNHYRLVTEESQLEATKRATMDAKDVEYYLRSTRKSCRRFSM